MDGVRRRGVTVYDTRFGYTRPKRVIEKVLTNSGKIHIIGDDMNDSKTNYCDK